jgi:ubiquinol-cytochrome c reductase cytochrome b subunit
VCLTTQLLTGLFLAIHYSRDIELAFIRVDLIIREVPFGWLIRATHANIARFFFICLYFHIARGVFFGSYRNLIVWLTGRIIFVLVIGTAFLGYVLPWGQMSFWGATVITRLVSSLPYGQEIVEFAWGGFSVGNPTLQRFYAFHFLLPFVLVGFTIIHLFFLHSTGSNNPLGIKCGFSDKVLFKEFYIMKDLLGFIFILAFLIGLVYFNLWYFGDPENFLEADPLITPQHIMPEWYFLFAYAVLRANSSKVGGVYGLFGALWVLLEFPLFFRVISFGSNRSWVWIKGCKFIPPIKFFFWIFIINFVLLTWLGAIPVEVPFINIAYFFSWTWTWRFWRFLGFFLGDLWNNLY